MEMTDDQSHQGHPAYMNGQMIVAEQLHDYCLENQIDVLLLQDPPTAGRRIWGFENDMYRTIMYDGEKTSTSR